MGASTPAPSRVAIPHVAAPGTISAELVLSKEDVRLAIDKLKWAEEELQRRRAAGSAAMPSAVVAALPTGAVPAPPPSAPSPVSPPLPSFVPVPGQGALPAAAATPQPQPRPTPLPAHPALARPTPPPAAAPPPAFTVPPAYSAPAAPPPPPAYAAPAAPPSSAYSAPAAPPPAAYAAAPAAPAVAHAGMTWQLCWSTEAADHNSDPVSALTYLPALPGLPGGDGHAGWLISSSRALLNLWECSPSSGRGEPALTMMHSQATDHAYAALEADRGMQLLLGACIDRSGAECLGLYSLDVESGMLAFKSRCPMPQPGVQRIAGQNCLQVASLHSFGFALEGCVAASYFGGIAVWQVGTLGKLNRPQQPRAVWKAHTSKITALHKSNFKLCLFSGAEDGTLHMWSMKEKPSAPALSWRLGGRCSGVQQANDHTVVAAGGDGRVMVWDLRRPDTPVKFAVPDSKPIHRIALSPFADCLAVATAGGLYAVDMLDAACSVTPIAPAPPRAPLTALTWNAANNEVVVGGGAGGTGSISVYRQRHAGY